MKYERIVTIGPGTNAPGMWVDLVDAGATRFRLNTSHMTPDTVERTVRRIRRADIPQIPIVLDLQGSKWRLGEIEPMELARGESVELVIGNGGDRSVEDEYSDSAYSDGTVDGTGMNSETISGAAGSVRRLPVPHPDFFAAAATGDGTIRLNDARVELLIERAESDLLVCTVHCGGPVSSRKGVSLPGATYRREELLPRDAEIIGRVMNDPGVTFALSYVRDAVEMERFDRILGGRRRGIAKIERPEAVASAAGIAAHAGEIWFCRGDLGAEVGLRNLAELYVAFNRQIRDLPVPVFLAGQVLEHMTRSPEPTRSEVCHLLDILQAGYAGIVLSDETAVGDYPVECCRAAAIFG